MKRIQYLLLAALFAVLTCADVNRDNMFDREADNYPGYPVADFYINGGTATSIYAPQPVTISAESTANPSGSALQYRWLFANDGVWTDWLSVPTITRNYSTLGTETVTLEVINAQSMTDSVSKSISVIDSNAPTASFTFSPTSPGYGATVTFDASGSTDDDSSAAEIQVRWDFENDGAFNTEWSAEKTATHVYDTAG
ncbi:MAG: hypothetical protein SVR08_07550, partial [Spirochaetota bacterium]|nr:hypothetical protein [Spirochaetota bacterium]